MPRPHPPEFRAEAIRLARSGERPIRATALSLGISESCLRRWLDQDDVDGGRREGLTSSEREELGRLRREVRVLRQEREILKKAAVGSTGHRNARSSIAAGVWYPSVLRGRVFSRSAIWSRSC
jgi:transposase